MKKDVSLCLCSVYSNHSNEVWRLVWAIRLLVKSFVVMRVVIWLYAVVHEIRAHVSKYWPSIVTISVHSLKAEADEKHAPTGTSSNFTTVMQESLCHCDSLRIEADLGFIRQIRENHA